MKGKLILLVIFIPVITFGQYSRDRKKYVFKGYDSISSKVRWTVDDLAHATVLLIDSALRAGTGLIISHNQKCYLLTAGHVANLRRLKESGVIFFVLDQHTPVGVALADITKNKSWKHHQSADVSLIELTPNAKDLEIHLALISFPSFNITESQREYSRDNNLLAIGYPFAAPPMEHLSPSIFDCKVANLLSAVWLDSLKVDYLRGKSCSVFLLDRPSIQGISGGGLFSNVHRAGFSINAPANNQTSLWGLLSMTIQDNTGGKMAAVMPSFYIWDLLNNE